MMALIRKDLRVLFVSPIAYVTLAVFVFLTGFAFNAQIHNMTPGQLPEASMRGMLFFIAVIFLFLSPFLTMRTFADEARFQTMELLKTSPLSDTQIVLAKFFAVWIFFNVMVLATWEFPAILLLYASPDIGPLWLSYLGLWLIGGAFIAVGVFTSSLVRSPMIAAILSFVILLVLWFLGGMDASWSQQLSIINHLETFSMGVLDLGDVAYYVLFTVAFIFLTVRVQEASRWK